MSSSDDLTMSVQVSSMFCFRIVSIMRILLQQGSIFFGFLKVYKAHPRDDLSLSSPILVSFLGSFSRMKSCLLQGISDRL